MAADKDKQHHHVAFASRHAKNSIRSLRAYSAITRAESLLEDIASLQELRTECHKANVHFGRFIDTYEFMNYYAVGFVTCLEWHARSRIVDLLNFKPDCITKEDIKNAQNEAVSQMMTEDLTVPLLVGAATTISSVESYTAVFQRVFKELGIKDKEAAEKILKSCLVVEERWEQKTKKHLDVVLTELFGIRHKLVHEVGWGTIGHFSLRDLWEVEWPAHYGNAALKCIQLMEAEITKHAPNGFPNRLDKDFAPEDDDAKIREDIAKLENELALHFAEYDEDGYDTWKAAMAASAASLKADAQVIEKAIFLCPVRHLDYRPEMEMDLLKLRLKYLKLLAETAQWYPMDKDFIIE